MGRVLLLAANAVRAIVDRRAIYLWGAAVLLTLIRATPALFFDGDAATRELFRAQAVAGALESWSALCIAAAIFIGAASVASDISTKTLITVLARPVARWEVVVGKWLGVTAFSVFSMAIGVACTQALAVWVGIGLDWRVLALAVAHTAVAVALFGGVAVAISAVSSSSLAASVSVLLVFVPILVGMLESGPEGGVRTMGRAIGAVTPIGFESQYRRVPHLSDDVLARIPSARRGREPLPAGGNQRILAENAAFTVVFLAAGCVFFSRRDIKL